MVIVAMKRLGVLPFLASALLVQSTYAVGRWLELTPIGGVESDEATGDLRPALEARLDAIERECTGRQTIVVRTKSLAAVFDHVRLAVNTNDLFVHWHPDSLVLSKRSFKRIGAFDAATPERRRAEARKNGGAVWSRLDMSHVCPDWQSILELGPTGLAERARSRRNTAASNGSGPSREI